VFAVLALPGSGYLWLDGLPFSRRTELAATVLMLSLFVSRSSREQLRRLIATRQSLRPTIHWVLAGLCVAKVLTFFWMPFGNGFEACYRSIYNPVAPNTCEKSYEMWWGTNRSSLGTANISRVESMIDFGPTDGWPSVRGASDSTWDLPFANDYPRFSELWLERLPFTASFVAELESSTLRFLPVHGTGEFSVTVSGQKRSSDSATAYAHDQTLVLPVAPGRHQLRIDYQHADSLEATIPDTAPTARGLSAQLFVGRPLSESDLREVVNLRLRLVVFDAERKTTPDDLLIRSSDRKLLGRAVRTDRPDVAEALGTASFLESGFDYSLKLNEPARPSTSLDIMAVSDGSATRIGTVVVELSETAGLEVRSIPMTSRWSTLQFSSWLELDTTQVEPLRPLGINQMASGLFSSLTVILNLLFLVLLLLCAYLFLQVQILALWQGSVSFVLAFLLAEVLWDVRLPFADSTPTLWLAGIVVILVAMFRSRITGASIIAVSIFASVRTITFITERFNAIPADAWWGRIIFASRDGDWFVGQGYARQILNEGSLRAGESVFYFQPGVRYLILLSHLLLGENDVLIAIGALGLLLFVVCEVGRLAIHSVATRLGQAACFTVIFLILAAALSQQLVTFAVAVASEYPTWILFAIAILCVDHATTMRSAPAVLLVAAIAGVLPNFRPNQIGGSMLLAVIAGITMWQVTQPNMMYRIGGILKVLMIYTSIALLSFAHNLHYGEEFFLYSKTGPLNSDFSWSSLINSDSTTASLTILWDKLRLGMYWTSWPSLDTLSLSFWGIQTFWLASLSWMVVRRQLSYLSSLLMLLPFSLLLPLLPYRFDSYYPRHIVVIQLTFAFGALAALRFRSDLRPTKQLEPQDADA